MDFFRAQVRARPEAIAVEEGGCCLTYAELDARSNRIANELLRQGLQLDHPVIIFLAVSFDFLAAIMGVLKAGGCYLPVSTETPVMRLQFLLEDCGTRFVLTDAGLQERFKDWTGAVLDVTRILTSSNPEADKDPGVASDPDRRAYITYTSGSTGRPKGVEIEHHAWTNLVWYYHQKLGVTDKDRSSMLSYVSFDSSVADIWPVLSVGGCLVIPPKDLLMNPDGLIAWLADEEVTLTFIPTGVAEILFTRQWPKDIKLRLFTTGGDRLRTRPPAGMPFTGTQRLRAHGEHSVQHHRRGCP